MYKAFGYSGLNLADQIVNSMFLSIALFLMKLSLLMKFHKNLLLTYHKATRFIHDVNHELEAGIRQEELRAAGMF